MAEIHGRRALRRAADAGDPLMLKLPEDTHNEPTSEVKYDNISGVSFGEPFDITWFD